MHFTTVISVCLYSLSIFFTLFPAITNCDNHINNNSRPNNNNSNNNNNNNNSSSSSRNTNNNNQNFLVALYSVATSAAAPATEGGGGDDGGGGGGKDNNNARNNVGLLPTSQQEQQQQKQQQQEQSRRSANGNTMAFAGAAAAATATATAATLPFSNNDRHAVRRSHTPPGYSNSLYGRRNAGSAFEIHNRVDEETEQQQQQQQQHHIKQRTKRDTTNNEQKQQQQQSASQQQNNDYGDGGGGGGGGDEKSGPRSEYVAENVKHVDANDDHQQQADLALHLKYKEQKFYNTSKLTGRRGIGGSGDGRTAVHTTATPELSSSNLVSSDVQEDRVDICQYCNCLAKNAFKNVFCDFTTNNELNPVFGRRFKVPDKAIAFTIQLAPSTAFRLSNGFFQYDKVNSLKIIGNIDGREQVEIETNSFEGNTASQLEMHFENINTVFMRSRSFSGDGKLTIKNCSMVKLWQNAFENASLHTTFNNIRDLRIEERAFNNGKTKLRIESSRIDDLYRFEASLNEVQFINCTLGTINTGTFDVHSINSIVFDGCTIRTIKFKAITDKLLSKHVAITHGKIGSIESEAIYFSGIQELILTENIVDTIQSNAIHVISVNVTISGNKIGNLEHNWLQVDQWSSVKIERNSFGQFDALVLDEPKLPNYCIFASNKIKKPQPKSLNIANGKCIMSETVVDKPCRCNKDWLDELTEHDLVAETFCTLDAKLSHCFETSVFNYLKYLSEVCDVSKTTLKCQANVNLKKIDGDFYTPEELEHKMSSWNITTLAMIIVSVVIIVALIIVLVIYCMRLRRPHSEESRHLHVFTAKDRETIDSAAKIVETKYPDFYKQFNSCRTQLYRPLSEGECVQVISRFTKITRDIGDDSRLTDFNLVLVRHMESTAGTAPSEIYSEPTGDNTNFNACYASNSIYPGSVGAYERENPSNSNILNNLSTPSLTSNENNEPIYAEPNCSQEPLLSNEYFLPADRSVGEFDAAAYTYSEPINSRKPQVVPKMNIPPPEYAQPHRHQNNVALAKQEFLAK